MTRPQREHAAVSARLSHRFARAEVKLEKTVEDVSKLSIAGRPVANLRYFPRLAAGQHETPAVNELVLSVIDNAQIAGVWTGEGKLSLPVAKGEEISDLQPVRVGAGFHV